MDIDKKLSMRDRSYARQSVGQDVQRYSWIDESCDSAELDIRLV